MQNYYECGCCGHYHKEGYMGDCRDDSERFTWVELMDIGVSENQIADLEGLMSSE